MANLKLLNKQFLSSNYHVNYLEMTICFKDKKRPKMFCFSMEFVIELVLDLVSCTTYNENSVILV